MGLEKFDEIVASIGDDAASVTTVTEDASIVAKDETALTMLEEAALTAATLEVAATLDPVRDATLDPVAVAALDPVGATTPETVEIPVGCGPCLVFRR